MRTHHSNMLYIHKHIHRLTIEYTLIYNELSFSLSVCILLYSAFQNAPYLIIRHRRIHQNTIQTIQKAHKGTTFFRNLQIILCFLPQLRVKSPTKCPAYHRFMPPTANFCEQKCAMPHRYIFFGRSVQLSINLLFLLSFCQADFEPFLSKPHRDLVET